MKQTGEYFLHLFSKKQPDLNWENPQVRKEVFDLMLWWLDKGIDGFRMDVINMISKAPGLPDADVTNNDRYQYGGQHFINGPRLLEFLGEMKNEVLSKYEILTVGETPGVTTQDGIEITNEETGVLNMLFQFEHMGLDADRGEGSTRESVKPWRLFDLKEVMTRWQNDLEDRGWNSIYLTNHDQPRAVSRFGNDGAYRVESAKLLATLTHLLQGTPYIYQGEEIGMTNVAFKTIDDYRDIETLNMYHELVDEKGADPQVVLRTIHAKSRDNARTPMQWNNKAYAGFSEHKPWIEVNPNYPEINVDRALADPDSIFYYYKKLIRLREQFPVIVYGKYELILEEHPQIYAFTRTLDDDRLLVMLNFSEESPYFSLPDQISFTSQDLLISNYPVDPTQDIRSITLRPYEARVYRLHR